MHTLPARPLPVLALLAALSACNGGSGDTSSDDSSTGTTAAPAETTATPDDTTGAPTTGEPEASTGILTTTGVVLTCDGMTRDNVFDCVACSECGSWTDPPPDGSYPAAMTCILEGLRDGTVVGATTESCNQGVCLNSRLLATGDGTVLAQQVVINMNNGTTNYQGIQELPLKDSAFFEACLAAYDLNCASSNNWFAGAATDHTMVTCP